LGNGLALFPVTQKLTVGGPLDGLHGSGFNGLSSLFIERFACHIGRAARSHHVVLHQPIDLDQVFVLERSLGDLGGEFVVVSWRHARGATPPMRAQPPANRSKMVFS
jgi:hypothetical protein